MTLARFYRKLLSPQGHTRGWTALVALLAFVLAAGGAGSAAGSERAVEVVQDQEKRSTIVEVDGYAQLAEDKSIREVRQEAFANARRQALENAESYIKSSTRVENFQLQYDLIESGAEGVVRVLEQKDFGIEQNSRYHVWIKAEVSYVLRPQAAGAPQQLMRQEAPLTVRVWTDKKHYRQGEYITIYLEGNRDFYARIVNIGSSGNVIQLLPNAYRQLHFFRGGQRYRIPDQGDHFNLKVTPPFGPETIVVYASEAPMGEVEMTPLAAGLQQFRGSSDQFSFQVRSIQPVARPGQQGSQQQAGGGGAPAATGFYEASWVLTTGP